MSGTGMAIRADVRGLGAGRMAYNSRTGGLYGRGLRRGYIQMARSTATNVVKPIAHTKQTPTSAGKGFTFSYSTSFQSSPKSRNIFRRLFSTNPFRQTANPTPHLGSPKESLSLGARMKKLSREYGWSALGVYIALSALDFPFCYLLVRYLGTDRIGEWEHTIVSHVKQVIPESVKTKWTEWRQSVKAAEKDITGDNSVSSSAEMASWGVEEAEVHNRNEASLATQLALAYAIHKSCIFIRVPLTAAVTPRVVKVLRGWGWDIGKRTSKAAKAAKRAENSK